MQMSKVRNCDVSECAYNMNQMCHAMAITIGDTIHPRCDTFCNCSSKGGEVSTVAGVGACKVDSCMHNTSLECQASEISVGHKGSEIDCLTFKSR